MTHDYDDPPLIEGGQGRSAESVQDSRQTGHRCDCGEVIGEPCGWTGELTGMTVIEWMPDHLRSSHASARTRGEYPGNGAQRLAVARDCAAWLIDNDGDWTRDLGPAQVARYAD